MSEYDVRLVAESESRAAFDVFRSTMHRPPMTEQQWRINAQRYDPDRTFGAFCSDGSIVGTAMSYPSSLVVPGGGQPAAEAVTCVGVRADHTRRGVLTSLMRAQLGGARQRGRMFSVLLASEAAIYGRYGYGPATWVKRVSLPSKAASFRSAAPRAGNVRLIDVSTASTLLPDIYRRIPRRPGMIERVDSWWTTMFGRFNDGPQIAVHSNDDGIDDGFALYSPTSKEFRLEDPTTELRVEDLHAADAMAAADLWRFLVNVDLVTTVSAADRPVDEPLEWWLSDPRSVQVQAVEDFLWVRVLDVPGALSARVFGHASPVVIDVRDEMFPENSGCYRLSSDGVARCAEAAQVSMDVGMLGALFLGGVSGRVLAEANRIEVHDASAVSDLDRLFKTEQPPWCGTGF